MKAIGITIISLALSLLASCSQVDTKETVLENVKEIYSKANDEPQDMSVFTTSFNELVDKVNKVDEGAELGYIDHILLTQSQENVEIIDINVVNVTENESNVKLAKSIGDTLRVVLKKENGIWKVDDVNDERKQMTEYCKDYGK